MEARSHRGQRPSEGTNKDSDGKKREREIERERAKDSEAFGSDINVLLQVVERNREEKMKKEIKRKKECKKIETALM